jgi:hypothetical protein
MWLTRRRLAAFSVAAGITTALHIWTCAIAAPCIFITCKQVLCFEALMEVSSQGKWSLPFLNHYDSHSLAYIHLGIAHFEVQENFDKREKKHR